MNIALRIAYDGGAYLGWQKTPAGPTIEGVLEHCLQTILNHPIQLQAASRTDSGVHAKDQVVNFLTESTLSLSALELGLKRLLPKDIHLLELKQMPDEFHPTLNCRKKIYTYFLQTTPLSPFDRHYIWHYPYPVDLTMLQSAAKKLVGKQNFKTFETQSDSPAKSTICEIFAIEISQIQPSRYQFEIHGDRFLYKMVRSLVGTLAQLASSKLHHDILAILHSQDRKQAGMTAPAHALFLTSIVY